VKTDENMADNIEKHKNQKEDKRIFTVFDFLKMLRESGPQREKTIFLTIR